MEELIFVYGTLKYPAVQKKIIGRTVKGHADTLPDFTKTTIVINGNTYFIVVPKKGEFVDGFVLSVLTKDLIKLDEYETKAYKRKKVILKSGVKAWVYQK